MNENISNRSLETRGHCGRTPARPRGSPQHWPPAAPAPREGAIRAAASTEQRCMSSSVSSDSVTVDEVQLPTPQSRRTSNRLGSRHSPPAGGFHPRGVHQLIEEIPASTVRPVEILDDEHGRSLCRLSSGTPSTRRTTPSRFTTPTSASTETEQRRRPARNRSMSSAANAGDADASRLQRHFSPVVRAFAPVASRPPLPASRTSPFRRRRPRTASTTSCASFPEQP